MALIKCSECGKEFSDKASACIHCGCPIENENIVKESKMVGVDFSKNFKDLTSKEKRTFLNICLTKKQNRELYTWVAIASVFGVSASFITFFLIFMAFNFSLLLLDILLIIIYALIYSKAKNIQTNWYDEYIKNMRK